MAVVMGECKMQKEQYTSAAITALESISCHLRAKAHDL